MKPTVAPFAKSPCAIAWDVRVFGSVVHGDDTECNDLDVLVEPTDETTLMDIAAIQLELERLLGITVVALTPVFSNSGMSLKELSAE